MTVNRTITETNDGQTVKIADDSTSTDGQPHTISLLLEQDFDGTPQYKFAGEPDYVRRAEFDSIPAPRPRRRRSTSATTARPRAAPRSSCSTARSTTPSGWDSADFYGSGGFYLAYRNRQIPAAGSVHLEWTYNTTLTEPDQIALARDAEDVYVGPSVAITAPANGSTTKKTPGEGDRHGDGQRAVASLTVNGAAVTPAADGTLRPRSRWPRGPNTITAIATDGAGNQSQAQVSVTYVLRSAGSRT